jgi:hydrogenase maturation protease
LSRVLVAGIGNIFFSDDAFGVALAQRLAGQELPTGARVEDFGIRGVHLAYELLEGYDALILLDALPMNEPPGTLVILEPDLGASPEAGGAPIVDAHTMSPTVVLSTLAGLGGHVARVYVLGCQPASLLEGMALSAPVAAAVEPAAELCRTLVAELCRELAPETDPGLATEMLESAGKGTTS